MENYQAWAQSHVRLTLAVRTEDASNSMKAKLNKLCERFDQFEKKAIRVIAVATALPENAVAVVVVLKFLERV